MSGSSHIRSVLIGVEHRNCCQTLDVYLLFFVILFGQIKSKLNYRLVTYKLVNYNYVNHVLIEFAPSKKQKVNKHPNFDNIFDMQRQLEHFQYDMNRTLLRQSKSFSTCFD